MKKSKKTNPIDDLWNEAGGGIDKNLLLVVGSIRNVLLCVKNFLPQDVGYGADECAEGAW